MPTWTRDGRAPARHGGRHVAVGGPEPEEPQEVLERHRSHDRAGRSGGQARHRAAPARPAGPAGRAPWYPVGRFEEWTNPPRAARRPLTWNPSLPTNCKRSRPVSSPPSACPTTTPDGWRGSWSAPTSGGTIPTASSGCRSTSARSGRARRTRGRRCASSPETPTTAIVDGDLGLGQVVARRAAEVALDKAARLGLAAVGIRRSNHIGRLADYAEMAAERGFVGLVWANAPTAHSVVPHGGLDRRLSTNPLAIAVPGPGGGVAISVDMATSIVAEGKVRVKRNRKEPLPGGWAIDPAGRPVTDAEVFYGPPPGGAPADGRPQGHRARAGRGGAGRDPLRRGRDRGPHRARAQRHVPAPDRGRALPPARRLHGAGHRPRAVGEVVGDGAGRRRGADPGRARGALGGRIAGPTGSRSRRRRGGRSRRSPPSWASAEPGRRRVPARRAADQTAALAAGREPSRAYPAASWPDQQAGTRGVRSSPETIAQECGGHGR